MRPQKVTEQIIAKSYVNEADLAEERESMKAWEFERGSGAILMEVLIWAASRL